MKMARMCSDQKEEILTDEVPKESGMQTIHNGIPHDKTSLKAFIYIYFFFPHWRKEKEDVSNSQLN